MLQQIVGRRDDEGGGVVALMNNFLKFDLCKHIFPGTTFFSEVTSAVCLMCYYHAR